MIGHNASEWAAPVLCVPKMDLQLRFCVSYRLFDKMKMKDSYPGSRMDYCNDSHRQANVFPSRNAYSSYLQMNIRKENRPKTTFLRTEVHISTSVCYSTLLTPRLLSLTLSSKSKNGKCASFIWMISSSTRFKSNNTLTMSRIS